MTAIPSVPPCESAMFRFLTSLRTAALATTEAAITDAVVETGHSLTLELTDTLVLVDATSATVIIRLPAAVSQAGKMYLIKKVDSSGNAVTVDPYGAETIDGSSTASLAAQWNSVIIKSNGRNWYSF